MSNYMQALKRLEKTGAATPPNALPAAGGGRGESARTPERKAATDDGLRGAPPALVAPRAGLSTAATGPEIALLLDRLRTLAAQGDAAHVLVFAPVAPGVNARKIVDALAARGRELSLPVAVAELTRSAGHAWLAGRDAPTRSLDLDAVSLPAAVAEWVDACGAAQLLLIDAPPVLASVDGLLLAAACDGLVLVAETGATERAGLRAAAERAEAAGCRTVGVVLTKR